MQEDLFVSRRDVLAILFRHLKAIVVIFLTAMGTAAFAVYYLVSPSYESQAVIMINSSYLTEPLRDSPPTSDFEKLASFHTQRDVISSERMAVEAVRRTKLAETRVIGRVERVGMFLGDIKRGIGRLLNIERWQKPWSAEAAAIAAVHDWVKTFALPDSNALRVTFRSKDPTESARVLEALLEAHRAYYYDVVRRKASGVVNFLELEFERSRTALKAAEDALFQFKRKDRLMAELPNERGQSAPSIVGITDDTKVQQELKLYLLKLEEELRVTEQLVDNERRQRVAADIKARIQRYLSALNAIPARELELVRLKRHFDIAQDNYQLVQRNLAKARLVASGETDKINLVDVFQRPYPDESVVFPQKRIILILAAALGLMLALTWTFVMDYLDHTLHNASDVERYLDVRLLASLGKVRARSRFFKNTARVNARP